MADTDKKFLEFMKKIVPGMPLRNVLDDLIKSNIGALIVFDSPELASLIEGGFRINCRFSPQRLFELCKMDGAIVVSQDLKRIVYANVLLTPDSNINTNETGTRHKAAERTAKQANTFTIAVSERRKKVTLYYSTMHTYLRNTETLMRETMENLQVLEKQRELFDELVSKLNILEMSGLVSVSDVCKVLQRTEVMLKTAESIKKSLVEMGKEGAVIGMRYKELLKGIEKTEEEVIRDYSNLSLKKSRTLLSNFTFEGLLDLGSISNLIIEKPLEDNISPSGFRFLFRVPSVNEKEASDIINIFQNLDGIFNAKTEDFEKILEGKGNQIKNDVSSLREQILSGKVIY